MREAGGSTEVIEVLEAIKERSPFGSSDVERWERVHTLRARVMHLRGTRTTDSYEVFSYVSVVIELPYSLRSLISYSNRIKHNGSIYYIQDIDANRGFRTVRITCDRVNE